MKVNTCNKKVVDARKSVKKHQDEVLVVEKSYTVVHPRTVLIHTAHTSIANATMMTMRGLECLALAAHVLYHRLNCLNRTELQHQSVNQQSDQLSMQNKPYILFGKFDFEANEKDLMRFWAV